MNTIEKSVDYFNENRNFSKFILKRYFIEFLHDDDMNQVADLGLWKACTTFNHSKEQNLPLMQQELSSNEVFQESAREKR